MFCVSLSKSVQPCAVLALLAALAPTVRADDAPAARALEEARGLLQAQAERAGLLEPRVEVALAPLRKPLPACATEPRVEPVETRFPSRMRFSVACPGESPWRQELVLRGAVSARVLVAVAELPANRPLQREDVRLERRDVTATADALSDPDALAGAASRRALRAGEVLRRAGLVAAVLVHRGEAVRIVARRGGVEVTVAGESMDDGVLGAAVRVRNAGSGAVVRARVTGEGTVQPVQVGADTAQSPE